MKLNERCPLDISVALTPGRIITELSRTAPRAHLTTVETEDWSSKAILAQNRGGRSATYESWTCDCEATRSGPIGLAETRGNQWRRQTIKSGSAFKGQLYFQVGQMKGPKVQSEARESRSAEGWGFGAPVAHPH